jgi:hypothetical protein
MVAKILRRLRRCQPTKAVRNTRTDASVRRFWSGASTLSATKTARLPINCEAMAYLRKDSEGSQEIGLSMSLAGY